MCQFNFAGFFEIFVITKCGKVILLQSVTDYYYKMPQVLHSGGSEFSSYEIELQNRVTQNDVTLRVTNSEIFVEIILSSY